MLVLYRISGKAYLPQDPSGAALSSEGRWHKKGQHVLHFSSSLPMCILELGANSLSYKTIRETNHHGTATLPEGFTSEGVSADFYRDEWQSTKDLSQAFGSAWYAQKRTLVLVVKSSVLPTENNFIINTSHSDFHMITFSAPMPIPLDTRLIEKEDPESYS